MYLFEIFDSKNFWIYMNDKNDLNKKNLKTRNIHVCSKPYIMNRAINLVAHSRILRFIDTVAQFTRLGESVLWLWYIKYIHIERDYNYGTKFVRRSCTRVLAVRWWYNAASNWWERQRERGKETKSLSFVSIYPVKLLSIWCIYENWFATIVFLCAVKRTSVWSTRINAYRNTRKTCELSAAWGSSVNLFRSMPQYLIDFVFLFSYFFKNVFSLFELVFNRGMNFFHGLASCCDVCMIFDTCRDIC